MTDIATQTLPPPPRPTNRRASRRSWNERSVRVWIISFLIVAAATAYFLVERIGRAKYERDLIFSGARVTATLTSIEGSTVAGRMFRRSEGPAVTLTFKPPNATQTISVDGRLTPGIEGSVGIGQTIEIRVDPADPRRWTDRTEPRPWTAELTVVYGLVPLLALLALLVLISRMRVMSVWRNGEEVSGTVVDTKHSSIAPMSRIVRFVLNDSDDKRVYTTLCPADAVPPAGDTIELIAPPRNPGRAIVRELYSGSFSPEGRGPG